MCGQLGDRLLGHPHLLSDQQHHVLQPLKALLQGLQLGAAGLGPGLAARCPTLVAFGGLDRQGATQGWSIGMAEQSIDLLWLRATAEALDASLLAEPPKHFERETILFNHVAGLQRGPLDGGARHGGSLLRRDCLVIVSSSHRGRNRRPPRR